MNEKKGLTNGKKSAKMMVKKEKAGNHHEGESI
jgi:hypothetical protein